VGIPQVPILDQAQGEGGLVDVAAVVLADLADGLDADGQALAGHGGDVGSLGITAG
jgi:hypothetical protein